MVYTKVKPQLKKTSFSCEDTIDYCCTSTKCLRLIEGSVSIGKASMKYSNYCLVLNACYCNTAIYDVIYCVAYITEAKIKH